MLGCPQKRNRELKYQPGEMPSPEKAKEARMEENEEDTDTN